MARLTIGQKAERVLKLLMGLRSPRVAAALATHGFTEDDLKEGWQKLAALTRQRLNVKVAVDDPRMIEELDAFENKWFPIARVSLERHYPELAAELFLNLPQTEGVEVAVSVRTFLERLEQLHEGAGPFGPTGPEAHGLLQRRGLTTERIAQAQQMLERLGTFHEEPQPDPTPEEQTVAEQDLWSWYLEWGGIARVALSDRRLLKSLGFLQTRRSRGDEEDQEEEASNDDVGDDVESDEAAPVAVVSTAGAQAP